MKKYKLLFSFLTFLFTCFVVQKFSFAWAAEYFVATNGNDNNSGSFSSPLATINKAHELVEPGDTIYVRGGTYSINTSISLNKNGTEQNTIKLFAYNSEKPIIDGSNLSFGNSCVKLSPANYWHIKGLEIRYCPEYGIYLSSANFNILQQLVVHHSGHEGNDGSGFQIVGVSTNNLILNCDSYLNDNFYAGSSANIHANADGFALKHNTSAINNVFRGCRSWRNADDGWDFWHGPAAIIENCWSWENGYDENLNHLGDGNGYKLGEGDGGHLVINSLAWKNYARGFDFNNSKADTLYNNTAYNNGSANFTFLNYAHVLRNNLYCLGSVNIESIVDDVYNSWNNPPGVTVTSADFVSLNDSVNRGSRQADGSLPNSDFLKLDSSSDCIDAGTNVGIPFSGESPDLGAYEYSSQNSYDLNGDGEINYQDLVLLVVNWGLSLNFTKADFNQDNIINSIDFDLFLKKI